MGDKGNANLEMASYLEGLPFPLRSELKRWLVDKLEGVAPVGTVGLVYFQYLAQAEEKKQAAELLINKVRQLTRK